MLHKKNLYMFGVLAALSTVTIWAMFLIGTRFAVSGNLTVDEVLVLRLVPAFLIMLPLMFKLGIFIPIRKRGFQASACKTLGMSQSAQACTVLRDS